MTNINDLIRNSGEAEQQRLSKLPRSALVREYISILTESEKYGLVYDTLYDSVFLKDAEMRRAILK